jgi:hypothetical protein
MSAFEPLLDLTEFFEKTLLAIDEFHTDTVEVGRCMKLHDKNVVHRNLELFLTVMTEQ